MKSKTPAIGGVNIKWLKNYLEQVSISFVLSQLNKRAIDFVCSSLADFVFQALTLVESCLIQDTGGAQFVAILFNVVDTR